MDRCDAIRISSRLPTREESGDRVPCVLGYRSRLQSTRMAVDIRPGRRYRPRRGARQKASPKNGSIHTLLCPAYLACGHAVERNHLPSGPTRRPSGRTWPAISVFSRVPGKRKTCVECSALGFPAHRNKLLQHRAQKLSQECHQRRPV